MWGINFAPLVNRWGVLSATKGFGRRKTIIIFQSIGAFSYFICAFLKPNIFMAILIMITSSLYAIAAPAFNSIVGDITTDENRKQSFSLVYRGSNIWYAVGPVVMGSVLTKFGYTYRWTAVSILNIIGAVSMFLLFNKISDRRCVRNAG